MEFTRYSEYEIKRVVAEGRIEELLWNEYHRLMAETAVDPNVLFLNEYTYQQLKMAVNKELERYVVVNPFVVSVADMKPRAIDGLSKWRGLKIIRKVEKRFEAQIEFGFGITAMDY